MSASLHRRRTPRRAGHTLVEVVVGAALLAGIAGPLIMLTQSGSRAFQTTAIQGDMETRARRALDRIVREMVSSNVGSMGSFPESPSWEESVDFDQVVDVAESDGTITWLGARIEFQYAEGETDDGTDENGNGLIDDGKLVLVRDPLGTPQATVLCEYVREHLEGETFNGGDDNGNLLVDEHGFCIERIGNKLTIRLTLERIDQDGDLATRTVETSIHVRN